MRKQQPEENKEKHYNKLTTYNDFVHYCLRRLGGGAINIEITDEQIIDRVSDALQYYREFHLESTIQTYYVHEVTQRDVSRGYLMIPPNIIDITDVKTTRSLTSGTDVDNLDSVDLLFWNSFWGTNGYYYGFGTGINTGLIYYELINQELETMNKVFNAAVHYIWHPRTNQLYLYDTLRQGLKLIIQAYKMVDVENNNNIWDSIWLKSYATALIGMQWGRNVSKFENIPASGGVTLDGEGILQRYTQQKEVLEEELRNCWEEPILPVFA